MKSGESWLVGAVLAMPLACLAGAAAESYAAGRLEHRITAESPALAQKDIAAREDLLHDRNLLLGIALCSGAMIRPERPGNFLSNDQ